VLDYVPTNEDQYGPFRVGPAYPLLFARDEIEFPSADYAHFGNRILKTNYQPHDPSTVAGEIACLEAMADRWARGVAAIGKAVRAAPERKRAECRRMRALRYSKKTTEDVSRLVFLHMRPHTFKMGWTDSAVRRYVRDAGDLLEPLNELVRCDVTTRNKRRERAISRRIDELEERIAVLREQEELEALRPPIDGNQVMEHLGLPPGRTVGEIMRMLTEYRIDNGPYSEEEAYAMLDDWAAENGS